MSGESDLETHLQSGDTTVCRCWRLTRKDGTQFGFTDHDEDVVFLGQRFRAETGMTPGALQKSTGLSVDNVEVVGALADTALTEADIEVGRLDGAIVEGWLVNWVDPEARLLQFYGEIGEITRVAGHFRADLRGLAEALNRPQGYVYQSECTAVLGEERCGVDLSDPAYRAEVSISAARERQFFDFEGLGGFDPDWFGGGRLRVLDGAAATLVGVIRTDVETGNRREIGLWQPLGAKIGEGDRVILEAGCDKRAETCKAKFSNFVNFRGCPHVPGGDWQITVPRRGGVNDGQRLR